MNESSSASGNPRTARLRRDYARLYPGLSLQTWYPIVRPLDQAGFFIRYRGRERYIWHSHCEVGMGENV
ncbi:MAG: hypothetical protein ABI679_10655 [Gemmatimonadota bacterium]